jgi:hypothetical protein
MKLVSLSTRAEMRSESSFASPDGRTVERQDRGLGEAPRHLLAHEEAVVPLVGVQVEILRELVIPVHLHADRVEGVEAAVGVAGEKVAVGARGLAEDDPLQLQVAQPGQQLNLLHQVRETVEHEGVGVLRCGVEGLDHGAVAHRAGLAVEHPPQIVVGAHQHGAVFHRAALAADRDLGARPRLAVVVGRVIVEALEHPGGGRQQARALLRQRLELGILDLRRPEDIDRHHRVDHRLVAGVVDLQHDVRAEGLDRIEQDRAGVDAEVARPLVEHHVVLLQVHRAAGEQAGARWDRQRRRLVPHLHAIEEVAAHVPAHHPLEVRPLQLRWLSV